MTAVPPWIAKAVIVRPVPGRGAYIDPICEWRATKTQVVVRTSPTGPEYRFHLDSLTMVGQPKNFPRLRNRLAPPDADEVVGARTDALLNEASWLVGREVTKQRLQDTPRSAEELTRKLTAIQDAVSQALAKLSEAL